MKDTTRSDRCEAEDPSELAIPEGIHSEFGEAA